MDIISMFLRFSRIPTPSRLSMGIRDVTGEAGGVGTTAPFIIDPVTELTLHLFGRGEGVGSVSGVGLPSRRGEGVMGIGSVTRETVLAVRFYRGEIIAVTGLTGTGASGVDRLNPLSVPADERKPAARTGVRIIVVTGVAVLAVQNGS